MVFKYSCVLVLWTKVALSGVGRLHPIRKRPTFYELHTSVVSGLPAACEVYRGGGRRGGGGGGGGSPSIHSSNELLVFT